MMRSCVVFDLDDTCYLERDYVRSGFQAVSSFLEGEMGMAAGFDELWGEFEAGVRGDAFDRLLARRGVAAECVSPIVRRLVRVYREHQPNIALLPDVLPALNLLRGQGFLLGLISDGVPEVQRKKIAALSLADRFDASILTGELGEGFSKPHPGAFKEMEAKLSVPGRRCTYVADNAAKDFTAPRTRGWCCVRVRRPLGLYAKTEAPQGGNPHIEVSSLHGIVETLQELLLRHL